MDCAAVDISGCIMLLLLLSVLVVATAFVFLLL